MGKVQWKENKVLSIETRAGLFVLAQMITEPYIIFYNLFRKDENWTDIDLSKEQLLFCTAVAREFLNSSNIVVQKKIHAEHCDKVNKYWIHTTNEYRTLKLWEGTKNEIEFLTMGHGGKLIEEDPYHQKGVGEEENIRLKKIDFTDNNTIDKYDLDKILFFPGLNERLYLCYKLGKNVDPLKDFVFDRKIPLDYEVYVKLYADKMKEDEWKKLPL